ncbi:nitroreductase [Halobellus sp. Atlit-38R]|uniref:Acg family FMN-binding oxidoreductase n=1 Tax=Halobellus sp. Atlit-38R TaxID=2282131 RepID=UPI000EF22729|nr:nitroreductase [Halobellus sp. Atlit-38R]RLM84257.1 nitroreductase [Halobellus sp. Atlit-38R]
MSEPELTRSVWEIDSNDYPAGASMDEKIRFLLRYAILAPSSHNSQPWRFRVLGNEVDIAVDESRWLDAADPTKRELYISVGCAIENLCVAAEHFEVEPRVEYHDGTDTDTVATVTFRDDSDPSTHRPSKLFDAITERSTSHELFDERRLDTAVQDELGGVVTEDDVSLHLVDEPAVKQSISELQGKADQLLMDDPEYRKELGHWIGLGALGSSWLMARIGQAVVTHLDLGEREAAKNSKLIESASLVAGLTTASDDPTSQVKAGQVFERVALLATTADVAVHPMSQTLERPELRTRLQELLDSGADVPQHLFRMGYTDEDPGHTPRWPLEMFLA